MAFILRSFFLSGVIYVCSAYNLIVILNLVDSPFLFSLDLSRLYFTSDVFNKRKYLLTYLLCLLNFEKLVSRFFTFRDIDNNVLLGTIYWSPVYSYCVELLNSFFSGFVDYANFSAIVRFLMPWCISLLLFGFAIFLSLNFDIFVLHELLLIRWIFLFLLILLSLLLFVLTFRSYDNDVVFVVRIIYFIWNFLLDLLEAIPVIVVRICSLFINSVVLICFFLHFYCLDYYLLMFFIYTIFILLWAIFVKLLLLFGVTLSENLVNPVSVFFIPTGVFVLYVFYSLL